MYTFVNGSLRVQANSCRFQVLYNTSSKRVSRTIFANKIKVEVIIKLTKVQDIDTDTFTKKRYATTSGLFYFAISLFRLSSFYVMKRKLITTQLLEYVLVMPLQPDCLTRLLVDIIKFLPVQ